MSRRAVLVLLAFSCLVQPLAAREPDDREVALFNGKDLSGWRKVCPDQSANLDETFTVDTAGKHIVVSGKPRSYLLTEKEYGNYELTLEWRWAGKPERGVPNSGILLHASGPDKNWPKSVEAQLASGHAGDIFLIDGFKLAVDKSRQDPRVTRRFARIGKDEQIEKPFGEWNTYVITCKGDTIRLSVNGKEVNVGEGSELLKGKIGLQCEGTPVHFRNIKLKLLD
jgi:hypothetical protein